MEGFSFDGPSSQDMDYQMMEGTSSPMVGICLRYWTAKFDNDCGFQHSSSQPLSQAESSYVVPWDDNMGVPVEDVEPRQRVYLDLVDTSIAFVDRARDVQASLGADPDVSWVDEVKTRSARDGWCWLSTRVCLVKQCTLGTSVLMFSLF